ncbi:MAG: hypothetical protein JWO69_2038 [Thermoleophilia bacterium]|nr:hypothetical protein [Thermoleophilia bacterium]
MTTKSLAEALAAFQADLPNVHKNSQVDTGRYIAKYADLATISAAVLPKLGAVGLSWVNRATRAEDGSFVLAYTLLHASGERMDGEYPLPDPTKVTPQQIGSAITYARRYSLCAAVGVAPDEDDDGVAASATKAAPVKKAQRGRPAQDEWAAPEPTTDTEWKAGWIAHVSTATSKDQLNELWADLGRAQRGSQCSVADAHDLGEVWKERAKDVSAPPAAETANALTEALKSTAGIGAVQ